MLSANFRELWLAFFMRETAVVAKCAYMFFFLDRLLKNVETEEKTNRNMTLPRNMIISWAYLENQNKSTSTCHIVARV